ncbi:MAG TPA: phosphoribosyltransferase family protein [Ramlibacter sp.]|jgi:ComF family protein
MPTAWLQRLVLAPPSRCAVCGAWPAQPVCGACIARFARWQPRCSRCALPVPEGVVACGACLREAPPLDACFAAVSYAYPWSGLVARFKFQAEPGWAGVLAGLIAKVPGVPAAVGGADLVLPMPLTASRLGQRGFNQALELARVLAGRRVDAGLLLRLRDTASQATLDRAGRQANVRGAFGIDPLRQPQVRGRSVLLVDDVMTSGASLHAAAAALRQAGAARVAAVVLARTDEPH